VATKNDWKPKRNDRRLFLCLQDRISGQQQHRAYFRKEKRKIFEKKKRDPRVNNKLGRAGTGKGLAGEIGKVKAKMKKPQWAGLVLNEDEGKSRILQTRWEGADGITNRRTFSRLGHGWDVGKAIVGD